MEVKITKTIISNNKEFTIRDDVHFCLLRNNKEYSCFGIIQDIQENEFQIYNVQIDGMDLVDELTVKYTEVKDGVLHLTDNSWY